jgi:glycerol-3-phosphate dehydrogenase (NAD(P)+)
MQTEKIQLQQELKKLVQKPVGVIGSGSFGTTVAFLLSKNVDVLLYSRKKSTLDAINKDHFWQGVKLSERIVATNIETDITAQCKLIFPVVPSSSFKTMIHHFAPNLRPDHLLIHATKGFALNGISEQELMKAPINRSHIQTMSEVITELSSVVRVGCLSGPNLSKEILAGQPAAAVVASRFKEVIELGKLVLNSPSFSVFGSHDIIGAELAGALKNVIALGSGILGGLNLGKNIQAMLITRGLREMIYLGNSLGAHPRSFLGTAGIGDLIATATSENSRNYTFGTRIAKGESMEEINSTMDELVEGVRTLRIVQQLGAQSKQQLPIFQMLYKVIYENYPFDRAMGFLMRYPYDLDVDFI